MLFLLKVTNWIKCQQNLWLALLLLVKVDFYQRYYFTSQCKCLLFTASKYLHGSQAEGPNGALIPKGESVEVNAIIVTCSYVNQEFIRIGYYVNTEYQDPYLKQHPPSRPDYSKLYRNVLSQKPRVTKFLINWDINPSNPEVGYFPLPDNVMFSEASNSMPDVELSQDEIGFNNDIVIFTFQK